MKKEKMNKTEKERKKAAGEVNLELTKKELDILSEYLESESFRGSGYGHLTLNDGTILTISCEELVKNKEDYEKSLEKFDKDKKSLEKELENAKKLAEERLNQLKYLQADFDNYRKQFEKEKERIIELANENLVKELIIILDDLDASLKSAENQINKEGIELIRRKFINVLEKHGLKEIESLGKKFNPNFHEVLCKELSDHEEDEIIEEIQKGYMLKSKVIRTSKVKVSKNNREQNLKIENKNEKIGGKNGQEKSN